MQALPIIDLSAGSRDELATQLDRACADYGFFYLVGHGIDAARVARLMTLSREFFARSEQAKLAIDMNHGGRAWRGYFPVGRELTSGTPDRKEGIYFGTELGEDDLRVARGLPLHGRNQFPELAGFREAVLTYMSDSTQLGHRLMALLAHGLGLDGGFFEAHYTADPLILFRIFNYPGFADSTQPVAASRWSVGEHTDYGLLTLLKQDSVGGLQVRHGEGWIDVPDVPDSFVCNVGDMLERLTNGRYLSALHRVLNSTAGNRLSMALFFDPSFDTQLMPIAGVRPDSATAHTRVRWDHLDPNAHVGTYGEYLLGKVGKVFPGLRDNVLP